MKCYFQSTCHIHVLFININNNYIMRICQINESMTVLNYNIIQKFYIFYVRFILQGSIRVYQGLSGSTRVYQGLQGLPGSTGSTRIYQGLSGSIRVYQGLHRSTASIRVHQGLSGSIRVYRGLPGSTRAYIGLPDERQMPYACVCVSWHPHRERRVCVCFVAPTPRETCVCVCFMTPIPFVAPGGACRP